MKLLSFPMLRSGAPASNTFKVWEAGLENAGVQTILFRNIAR